MCDFCGPNSTHHTQHCFKLQALNAKVDRIKHQKQIAGNSTNRRQFKSRPRLQTFSSPAISQPALSNLRSTRRPPRSRSTRQARQRDERDNETSETTTKVKVVTWDKERETTSTNQAHAAAFKASATKAEEHAEAIRGARGGNKRKWKGRRDQRGQQDSQRHTSN